MTDFDLKQLEELIVRGRQPYTLGDGMEPIASVPDNVNLVSLEQYLDAPVRVHRALVVTTLESFNRYFNEFKIEDSRIYVDGESVTVIGIIDDHQARADGLANPMWCDHRVVYKCPFSRQWEAWKAMDRRKVGQVEFAEWLFAEWLEDRTQDVQEPSGSELLSLCTALQIHRRVVYGSATRLASGEHSFQYSEDNETGTMEMPAEITLGIPVFRDGTNYKITARFRYRLVEGNLTLWYELVEPDKYVEDAFNEVVEAITDETETMPLHARMSHNNNA